MKIIIETIPHDTQRYPTVGDWWFEPDGTLQVRVSAMHNERYEALVGLHEVIEALLCEHHGIDEQTITDFDVAFEAERAPGNTDEPGDACNAPYRREHFFATSIERLLAAELGVKWHRYEDAVNDL